MFSVPDTWGYSSAGRALAWHARGQEFDPPYLHHKESDNHAVYEPRGYFLLHEKSKKVSTRVSNKKTTVTSDRNCRFFIHSLRKRDRAWQQKCYATVPLHLTMLPEWDSGKRIRQPYLFGYGNRCFRQSL